MAKNPPMMPGVAKMSVYIPISVINCSLRSPSVLNTANSYRFSSISVCIKLNVRMKASRHTKKMTVTSTLLSIIRMNFYRSI